jgi:hypothetical protein
MYTFAQLFGGLKTEQFRQALTIVRDATIYAERTSADVWEYAVEIKQVLSLGLTENDLRYLVRLKLLEHASELEEPSANGRQFVSVPGTTPYQPVQKPWVDGVCHALMSFETVYGPQPPFRHDRDYRNYLH